jgi:NADPH:quinone reductase-like Zn-dependent oxidoreductase
MERHNQTMSAAAMRKVGAPGVLKLEQLPRPEVSAGEVLIALEAAGVGIWDVDIRKGWWPKGRPTFPLVLGSDGAGIVVAKGSRVRRLEIGDRVWASVFINPKGGFYAQYAAVPAADVARIPKGLDLLHAGAGAVTALTAQQGVEDVLRIRRGETVLIFGATGAVGTLAVQFARSRGARVVATATGVSAKRLVKSLGATETFDARAKDAIDRLHAAAPGGLDAVLAFAGGSILEACLDLVKPGGRVAFPYGVEPEPKRRGRKMSVESYDADANPRLLSRLEQAVEKARLTVPIAAVYPLARAAQAHERLERGGVLGRIVLRIPQAARKSS